MSVGWQDALVALIAILAAVFLYRHFRPRRPDVVAVIPASALRVRKPRSPSSDVERPKESRGKP